MSSQPDGVKHYPCDVPVVFEYVSHPVSQLFRELKDIYYFCLKVLILPWVRCQCF